MITNVYVDGFNLYYGALKGTPYKWLDLEALFAHLLPVNQINRIRYFTAKVQPRADDPGVDRRQQVYIRALRTLPSVSIHLGRYQSKPTRMPLEPPPTTGAKTVKVMKTEEKGSDVNLASLMLLDAFRDDAEAFVVVSNDSDLMEPTRIVRQELGKRVGLLNPHPKVSYSLMRCKPHFVKQIHAGALAASQFPASIPGTNLTKPTDW